MHHKIKAVTAVGLLMASLPATGPAAARETAKHDLGSGPHVYRVEIRNLHRLEVLEAGDSDGVGELHKLTAKLSSFNPNGQTQYHSIERSGTELYLYNKGGIIGGRRNMPIRAGDFINFSNHRPPRNRTQLWVHAYANPADRDFNTRHPGAITVHLKVSAAELDCALQRVCRRRSRGSVNVSFKIPEFETPPPHHCGPSNTFQLAPVDGKLQIFGLSSSRVRSHTSDSSPWPVLTKSKKGGPRLRPFNADICIASSTRQPAIRRPSAAERDAARRSRRLNR